MLTSNKKDASLQQLYTNFDMSILQSHFIEVYKSFVPISIKLFHQFHEPVAECAIFTSPVF